MNIAQIATPRSFDLSELRQMILDGAGSSIIGQADAAYFEKLRRIATTIGDIPAWMGETPDA